MRDTSVHSRDGFADTVEQRTVRRVLGLLLKGEIARATAAAWGAAAGRSPTETAEAFAARGTGATDDDDIEGAPEFEAARMLRLDVEDYLRRSWRRFPKERGLGRKEIALNIGKHSRTHVVRERPRPRFWVSW